MVGPREQPEEEDRPQGEVIRGFKYAGRKGDLLAAFLRLYPGDIDADVRKIDAEMKRYDAKSRTLTKGELTPRAFLNRRGTESLGPPSSNLAGSIILADRPGRFGRRVGCCCTRGVRASLGAAEGQSARIAGFELPCLPTWIRVRGNLATCMHGVWGAGFYEGGGSFPGHGLLVCEIFVI